jgi:hypothetical protein
MIGGPMRSPAPSWALGQEAIQYRRILAPKRRQQIVIDRCPAARRSRRAL